jgi:LAGLIDADG DNA endonuclease family protein
MSKHDEFNSWEEWINYIEKKAQEKIISEDRKLEIIRCFSEARELLAKSHSVGRKSGISKIFKKRALERIHPIYMDLNIGYDVLAKILGRSTGWFSTNFTQLGLERKSTLARVPNHPTKYDVDVTVFDEWSPESAYWLGFIWADGHVRNSKHRKHVRIAVQESDSQHLSIFQRFLKSNIPVKRELYRSGKDGNLYPASVITINRKELAHSLIKHNVVVNRSSSNTALPKIPKTFFWDFIRGYFDGDGAIHRPQKSRFLCSGWAVSFAGSETTLRFLQKCIRQDVGIEMDFRPNGESQSNFSLTRTGPEGFRLLKRLYPNDDVVGLARKKSVIRRLLKAYDYALSNGVVVASRGDGTRFIVPKGFSFSGEFEDQEILPVKA